MRVGMPGRMLIVRMRVVLVMGVSGICGILLFLRPVLFPRHILFAVNPDVHLGGRNSAAHHAVISSLAPIPSAATVFSSSFGDTPASTRAPRNMSPLMPEKHSR